jgi:cyclic beta-1,2-glucan synthetase
MYRAGVEGILGIRREGAFLVVDPCIPASWPGFEATVKVESTCYHIRLATSPGRRSGVLRAVLDGVPIANTTGGVRVALDGGTHTLLITYIERKWSWWAASYRIR